MFSAWTSIYRSLKTKRGPIGQGWREEWKVFLFWHWESSISYPLKAQPGSGDSLSLCDKQIILGFRCNKVIRDPDWILRPINYKDPSEHGSNKENLDLQWTFKGWNCRVLLLSSISSKVLYLTIEKRSCYCIIVQCQLVKNREHILFKK